MEVVYSLEGRAFRIDGDRLWTRDGVYVGKQVDGLFYNPSGVYVGEFKGDRLGFNMRHAGKPKMGHMSRMNKMGISRMDKMAKSMPAGWEEFRG